MKQEGSEGQPLHRPALDPTSVPALANQDSPTLPRLVIDIALEGKPVVRVDCLHETDTKRLQDWIAAQYPSLDELIRSIEQGQ
jgi:hypothetical protein